MLTLLQRPHERGDERGHVVVAATERDDGDFHPRRTEAATLARRQRTVNGRVWAMVDQVHGVRVHRLDANGAPAAVVAAAGRTTADVIVGAVDAPVAPIAVWAADCAPLFLIGERGAVVGTHAGWRGLAAGIVDVAFGELGGEGVAAAVLGPVIGPCCYPFGPDEIGAVAVGIGVPAAQVTGRTTSGAVALDVPTAVAAALARHRIALDAIGPCTGCDGRWFSHRRGDAARHAVVAWWEGCDG